MKEKELTKSDKRICENIVFAVHSNEKEKDYNEIAHIKGLYSFVLSIEKNGVENGYSDKMKSLLVERGYETLKQLLSSLGNDELNKNEIDDLGSH